MTHTGAHNNLVGGEIAARRNVISGNGSYGVVLQGLGTDRNQVVGNYIGTDLTGMTTSGNSQMGVMISYRASNNAIGGEAPGAGNVISGNETGVWIQDFGTSGNQVLGNRIGSDYSGMLSLGNRDGVVILNSVGNMIGSDSVRVPNLISGNHRVGILITGKLASGNTVSGNYVGTNRSGTTALPNQHGVVLAEGCQANTIGISNTIAYNGGAGILIVGDTTLGNTLSRNIIHHNVDLPIDFEDTSAPLSPPILTHYSPTERLVTGSACAGCPVEIYSNPNAIPAGTVFLVATGADSAGRFTVALPTRPPLPCLSATATDLGGTTSEFSGALCVSVVLLPLILR